MILKIILLHNKIDLQNGYFENEFDAQLKAELFPEYTSQIIAISAKNKTGIEALKSELIRLYSQSGNAGKYDHHQSASLRGASKVSGIGKKSRRSNNGKYLYRIARL